eukprot:4900397-Alexandrium_andersonii.AAC.1
MAAVKRDRDGREGRQFWERFPYRDYGQDDHPGLGFPPVSDQQAAEADPRYHPCRFVRRVALRGKAELRNREVTYRDESVPQWSI